MTLLTEPTVTFRLPRRLLMLRTILAPVAFAFLLQGFVFHSRVLGSLGLYLCFATIYLLASGATLRVTLTPDGIRIRRLWHRKQINWPDIQRIAIEPQALRTRQIVLWTLAGVRVALPVPFVLSDNREEAEFLAAYHQIGQYWTVSQRRPGYQGLSGYLTPDPWWVR